MGVTPPYSLNDIPGPSSYSVVAPFAADIDTTRTGSVKYTQFTTFDSQMNTVSTFIRSETGNSFYGTRMMVAEWNGVPRDYGSTVSCKLYNVSTCVSVCLWAIWYREEVHVSPCVYMYMECRKECLVLP